MCSLPANLVVLASRSSAHAWDELIVVKYCNMDLTARVHNVEDECALCPGHEARGETVIDYIRIDDAILVDNGAEGCEEELCQYKGIML